MGCSKKAERCIIGNFKPERKSQGQIRTNMNRRNSPSTGRPKPREQPCLDEEGLGHLAGSHKRLGYLEPTHRVDELHDQKFYYLVLGR